MMCEAAYTFHTTSYTQGTHFTDDINALLATDM